MRLWCGPGPRKLALVLVVAACGRHGGAPAPEPGGFAISFEDRVEPGAFQREAPATRDDPDGAEGLWAAVRDLPRPERAIAVNPENGAQVVLALFRGGSGPEIRLSNAAADALGIGAYPAVVRITALRQEARIERN